ncbi:MAG: rhodanese family protein [Hyphomonadaceae bacterium]|jgi:rhodanese-related sulfurtransferase|nr:rhodanese family protein [Hyphomonadaceae bacterium]
MSLIPVAPEQARQLMADGARLIDIREADEHARAYIAGAESVPLSGLGVIHAGKAPVIYHCRSGVRTMANAARLSAATDGPAYVLEGGIDAWRKAGLPVVVDQRQPLELMRQVQLAAGGLVLSGTGLGFLVTPAFFGISAFVGAGLMVAGATGWCGMARLLNSMPWNRRVSAA